MAMLMLIRRMELTDITVHGFRVQLPRLVRRRDDIFPCEVAEAALRTKWATRRSAPIVARMHWRSAAG